jgi:fatty-acyl-CoA synthase
LSSILDDAGTGTTATELIDFCKTHMARFKAPKYFEFGDLPKTATGGIQKFKLREKEWHGHQRKVA